MCVPSAWLSLRHRMYYNVYMGKTTITVRTDDSLREALLSRAQTCGSSLSEVVREILEEALIEKSLGVRVRTLRGALRLPESGDAWRDELRSRNWRP